MDINRQTFGKTEKLCSVKLINDLFTEGNTIYTSLFKLVWKEAPDDLPVPAQIAFSVSKKQFRRAVKRNLIKRRMRETYRKNKFLLYDYLVSKEKKIVFMIIFRGKEIPDYNTLDAALNILISRLINTLSGRELKC